MEVYTYTHVTNYYNDDKQKILAIDSGSDIKVGINGTRIRRGKKNIENGHTQQLRIFFLNKIEKVLIFLRINSKFLPVFITLFCSSSFLALELQIFLVFCFLVTSTPEKVQRRSTSFQAPKYDGEQALSQKNKNLSLLSFQKAS